MTNISTHVDMDIESYDDDDMSMDCSTILGQSEFFEIVEELKIRRVSYLYWIKYKCTVLSHSIRFIFIICLFYLDSFTC